MPIVPKKIPEKIAWYSTREPVWTAEAANINVTAGQMTTMSGYIADAVEALAEHQAAQSIAKAKTLALYEKARIMGDFGASLIKQIKAKAEQVGGTSVYTLAQIPAPATPTPVGELTKPTDFSVGLDETGALTIGWKCAQPKSATAVVYQVWRRIGSAGEFVNIGGTGSKEFYDNTVPAGSAQVTYRVQAQRSTSSSPWGQFVVSFGVQSGETVVESVVETPAAPPAKIAA
jgi:hypothetical protein